MIKIKNFVSSLERRYLSLGLREVTTFFVKQKVLKQLRN